MVERALMRLPVEQRAAVVAVDMQGYSVAETARMLGVAEGTVKSRCSRARAKLAEALGYFDTRAGVGRVTRYPGGHSGAMESGGRPELPDERVRRALAHLGADAASAPDVPRHGDRPHRRRTARRAARRRTPSPERSPGWAGSSSSR